MVNPAYWVAMFSQTGSELRAICDKLGFEPTTILCNNMKISKDEIRNKFPQSVVVFNKSSVFYESFNTPDTLPYFITLHGWLRIFPPELCNKYEVYNGHPGGIIDFPELKGINPQQKAIDLGLPFTYNVLHKVIEGVDEGEVIACSPDLPVINDLDYMIKTLRDDAVDMWVEFLKEQLFE